MIGETIDQLFTKIEVTMKRPIRISPDTGPYIEILERCVEQQCPDILAGCQHIFAWKENYSRIRANIFPRPNPKLKIRRKRVAKQTAGLKQRQRPKWSTKKPFDFDEASKKLVNEWTALYGKQFKPFLLLAETVRKDVGNPCHINNQKFDAIHLFWRSPELRANAPILTLLLLLTERMPYEDVNLIASQIDDDNGNNKAMYINGFRKVSCDLSEIVKKWREDIDNRYTYFVTGRENKRVWNAAHYRKNSQRFREDFVKTEFLAALCFQCMMYHVEMEKKNHAIDDIDCQKQWKLFQEIWPYDWQIFWPKLIDDSKGTWLGEQAENILKNLNSMPAKYENEMLKKIEKYEMAPTDTDRETDLWFAISDADNYLRKKVLPSCRFIYRLLSDFHKDSIVLALLNGPYSDYYKRALFIFGGGEDKDFMTFRRPYEKEIVKLDDTIKPRSIEAVGYSKNYEIAITKTKGEKTSTENVKEEKIDALYCDQFPENGEGWQGPSGPWKFDKIKKELDSKYMSEIVFHKYALPVDRLMFPSQT